MPTLNRKARIVAAVLLAVVIAIALGCGPDETEVEQKQYCDNVRDGYWPDYNGSYKAECGGKNPPKFDGNLTK